MLTLHATLSTMRRPTLLMQAARYAAQDSKDLGRISQRPVSTLLIEEERLNTARLHGGLGYSPLRHVEVMGAILSAARQEQQNRCATHHTKASGMSALRVVI